MQLSCIDRACPCLANLLEETAPSGVSVPSNLHMLAISGFKQSNNFLDSFLFGQSSIHILFVVPIRMP